MPSARRTEVRLIAERRYGELLKMMARTPPQLASPGGRAGKESIPTVGSDSPYAQALADTGVSTQNASRYQALADQTRKPVVRHDRFRRTYINEAKRLKASNSDAFEKARSDCRGCCAVAAGDTRRNDGIFDGIFLIAVGKTQYPCGLQPIFRFRPSHHETESQTLWQTSKPACSLAWRVFLSLTSYRSIRPAFGRVENVFGVQGNVTPKGVNATGIRRGDCIPGHYAPFVEAGIKLCSWGSKASRSGAA